MRNWIRCSGVYTTMLRALFLVCSVAALAQPVPPQDPLDARIQAVWQAHNSGRFEEAAAIREQARVLLQHKPVDAPQFPGWVQQVAQLYQNAGLHAQERAILTGALAHTGTLGDSHPSRIAVLNALGEAWRQDGNLLKAVESLELAAAAEEAAQAAPPPMAVPQPVMVRSMVFGKRGPWFADSGAVYAGNAVYSYLRLADLYQQLGRPDAVAAIAVKIRTLGANDLAALARFHEQHGPLEEAGAIYRKMVDQAPDAPAKANAWQSLADFYARHERFTDAVAASQQAIATAEPQGAAGMDSPLPWMRQNLAGYLRQAGQNDQADQVYQQLLQQSQGGPQESQMLALYAQYLAGSERAAQGESLLKDYLAGHANLDPQQKMNLLFQLANVVRGTGDSARAEGYQQAAQALQPLPPPDGQILIGNELQKALAALNQHRLEDAYGLALHVIDLAGQAVDGQQAAWIIPQIAQALAANREPAKAGLLFQRLLAMARSRSADSMQPLIVVTENYARFLMNQPDRPADAPAALERYRAVLLDANGPESGSLSQPLRMKIEFERTHSLWQEADASARELLELQESLNGNTSDPYLGDLQNVARLCEAAGDSVRAAALFRKAVTIADLLDTPDNGWRRSQTRMEAALALARLGQFEEAEKLAEEAIAMQTPRVPVQPLQQQLEEIRRMKSASRHAR